MALTDVEICNRALVKLGANVITAFDDGSDRGVICEKTYPGLLEQELSTFPWRFAMKKQQLARLTAEPVNEWKYAFQLPSDRIGDPFAVFASSNVGAKPIKGYEVFADHVYCNNPELWADYPFKPDPTAFPAYFTEFLVLAMASALAIPITDQANLADYYHGLAYGAGYSDGAGGMLGKARNANMTQHPPQMIDDFELINARY